VAQSWSQWFGDEENVLPLLGIRLQFLICPAYNLVTTLTAVQHDMAGI